MRSLVGRPSQHCRAVHRIRALGGGAENLLRVAAHLYSLQGRPELALAIYLRLHQSVSRLNFA